MKATEIPVLLYSVYYAVYGDSSLYGCRLNPYKWDHSYESYSADWVVLSCGTVYYAVSGDSSMCVYRLSPYKDDHSNESYWVVLSCGTVYDAVSGDFSMCL